MESYFGLLVMIVAAAGTAVGMLVLHHWLGPKSTSKIKELPFECGNPPNKIVRGQFSIKFFVVALLFILFDIELIFLFPWAVAYKSLGLFGFVEMLVFLAVVVAGLFYSVKRGALEWN